MLPSVSPDVITPPVLLFLKSTSFAVAFAAVEPTMTEPFVAVILPDVAVNVVPAVTEPLTDGLLFKLIVTVDPLPLVFILYPPAIVSAPLDGVAVPESVGNEFDVAPEVSRLRVPAPVV